MLLRRLTENDLDAFWELRLRALRDNPEAFATTYEETLARGKATMLRRLEGRDDMFVIGAFDEKLIGIVGFFREPGHKERHKGHLISFYVLPERRRQGIGKALVQELLAQARRIDGLELIELEVVTGAAAALAVYRSFGFQLYGRRPRSLKADGRYWDTDLMVLLI